MKGTRPLGRIQGRQAHGKAVAQVKGGNYTLGHIRDFRPAMQNEEADLGVFVVTYPKHCPATSNQARYHLKRMRGDAGVLTPPS